MAEPRGQLPGWMNSPFGRFLLSALDTQIPGNAFNANWGSGQAPTHNFTNPREFFGLGQIQRGFNSFGNFLGDLNTGARGVGTSFGRMFDGNPNTGFFNNPTAPWNWGNGPANVPQGHPDFMGPVQYGPPQSQTYTPDNPSQWGPPNPNQEYSPGDPREWGPPAPSKPRTNGSAGNRGNSLGSFSNFGGRGPVASGLGWRSYGGTGGPLGGGRESEAILWPTYDR